MGGFFELLTPALASLYTLGMAWALRQGAIVLFAGTLCLAHADDWHDAVSPHFVIHQERVFGHPGLNLNLEKIHNRLRMDLAMFSPWMEKERINLYLYADAASFQQGEFHPPAWSNGLAYYDSRTVVVYDQPVTRRLYQIIAHEMTHLLFESYWGDAHKEPPHWLNEGLAMMEETEQVGAIKGSAWFRAMVLLGPGGMPPFTQMLETVPSADLKDKNAAGLWYVEAYSVVYFLYREHTRLQFHNFNENLTNGKSLQEALWLTYRFPSTEKFEAAWREWLRQQSVRYAGRMSAQDSDGATSPADFDGGPHSQKMQSSQPLNFDSKDISFHNLRGDGD